MQTPGEQLHQWFQRFLALACEIAACENGKLSDLARHLVAENYPNLWRRPGLRSELAAIAKALNERHPWLAGWTAVRSIKDRDYRTKNKPDDAHGLDLLNELDELLKPRDRVDQIRTYVLSPAHIQLGLDNEFDFDDPDRISASRERAAARAFDLGQTVAGDPDIIREFSEELFRTLGGYVFEL